jgi:parvulin-like peptidyl-prolyl isomerase
MSQRKAYIISLFALTFLIGAASGYFLRGSVTPMGKLSPSDPALTGTIEQPDRSGQRNRYDRPDGTMRERLITELNLRDEQISPFFDITLRHRRLIRDISEDHRVQLMRELRAQSDSLDAELRGLLSTEQYLRWSEMQTRYMREQNRVRQQNRVRERE